MYIKDLLKVRVHEDEYQVYIWWLGFEKAESTWEPISVIVEDIPGLMKSFLRKQAKKGSEVAETALKKFFLPNNMRDTGKSVRVVEERSAGETEASVQKAENLDGTVDSGSTAIASEPLTSATAEGDDVILDEVNMVQCPTIGAASLTKKHVSALEFYMNFSGQWLGVQTLLDSGASLTCGSLQLHNNGHNFREIPNFSRAVVDANGNKAFIRGIITTDIIVQAPGLPNKLILKSVDVFLIDNPNWTKILIGEGELKKLGISPSAMLLDKLGASPKEHAAYTVSVVKLPDPNFKYMGPKAGPKAVDFHQGHGSMGPIDRKYAKELDERMKRKGRSSSPRGYEVTTRSGRTDVRRGARPPRSLSPNRGNGGSRYTRWETRRRSRSLRSGRFPRDFTEKPPVHRVKVKTRDGKNEAKWKARSPRITFATEPQNDQWP